MEKRQALMRIIAFLTKHKRAELVVLLEKYNVYISNKDTNYQIGLKTLAIMKNNTSFTEDLISLSNTLKSTNFSSAEGDGGGGGMADVYVQGAMQVIGMVTSAWQAVSAGDNETDLSIAMLELEGTKYVADKKIVWWQIIAILIVIAALLVTSYKMIKS